MSNDSEYLFMLTGCWVMLFEILLINKKEKTTNTHKNKNKLQNHMLNKEARHKKGVRRLYDSIYMKFKSKEN